MKTDYAKYQYQLRIPLGAAITSYNLLLLAEEIAKEEINLQNVGEKFSCLSTVEMES